jgi:hypothetical protein
MLGVPSHAVLAMRDRVYAEPLTDQMLATAALDQVRAADAGI